MSCNELVWAVSMASAGCPKTHAALGNIHGRRRCTGCPPASCTSPVTPDESGLNRRVQELDSPARRPRRVPAVADLDAAIEVLFELLPLMGGPEPRAALQHQRRFRVPARGAPRAGSVQLPGTQRPRLRWPARLRAPCAPAPSRRDLPANGSRQRGPTPCRRRLSAPGASWHGAIVETRTGTARSGPEMSVKAHPGIRV